MKWQSRYQTDVDVDADHTKWPSYNCPCEIFMGRLLISIVNTCIEHRIKGCGWNVQQSASTYYYISIFLWIQNIRAHFLLFSIR